MKQISAGISLTTETSPVLLLAHFCQTHPDRCINKIMGYGFSNTPPAPEIMCNTNVFIHESFTPRVARVQQILFFYPLRDCGVELSIKLAAALVLWQKRKWPGTRSLPIGPRTWSSQTRGPQVGPFLERDASPRGTFVVGSRNNRGASFWNLICTSVNVSKRFPEHRRTHARVHAVRKFR